MPIVSPMRNPLTGDPVRVNVNPQLNREPGRKGIIYSGLESTREFHQLVRNETVPSIQDLGNKAVTVLRSTGIDLRV